MIRSPDLIYPGQIFVLDDDDSLVLPEDDNGFVLPEDADSLVLPEDDALE